jgi:WD40 repeat protein
LQVINLETGGKLWSYVDQHDVTSVIVGSAYDTALVVYQKGTLATLNLSTGQLREVENSYVEEITGSVSTPDGTFAILFERKQAAIVFDFEHREVLGRFLVSNELASGGPVTAIALGADRPAKRYKFRIIRSHGNEIKVWDAVLSNLYTRESERASNRKNKRNFRQAAAFRQAAKILRNVTEKVQAKGLFRSSEEDSQSTWVPEQSPCDAQLIFVARGHHGVINSIAVSRDGQRMLSASDDCSIKEWNAESGALLHTLRGHTDKVYATTFAPDGTKAISVSADDTIKVWSLTRGGGTGVLGRSVRTRNLDEMGRDIPLLTQGARSAEDSDRPGSYVCALEVTQDGRKVLAVSKDESLSVLNVLSHEEIARLAPSRESGGRWVHRHRTNAEFHTKPSLVEYFSPRLRITSDGMRALLTSRNGSILMWNIWSGLSKLTEASQITEEIYGIRDFTLSNDNKLILYVTDDRCITAVDGSTGKILGRL